MKIRSGFVSNSSSASFILLVDLNKEDFLSLFKEGFYRYENIVLGYKGILTEMIEKNSKYMEKYKDKEDLEGYEKMLYDSHKEDLKDLEEVEKINFDTVSEETEWIYLKKILELDRFNVIIFIFLYLTWRSPARGTRVRWIVWL